MRFVVELLLSKEKFPKDKNKKIMHIMKLLFEKTDKKMYRRMYEEGGKTYQKEFSFSVYMGRDIEFLRDSIVIPEKKILLNWSSYDLEEAMLFYNSMITHVGLEIPIEDNLVTINDINIVNEKTIMDDALVFKTLSPICVREHKGDNDKTWYHSLSDDKGYKVFRKNLEYQLKNKFPQMDKKDLEEIKVHIMGNKTVNIKQFDIVIKGNIGVLKINAKPYILDYIYKSGLGSRRGSGFGLLDIV